MNLKSEALISSIPIYDEEQPQLPDNPGQKKQERGKKKGHRVKLPDIL